MAQVQLDLALPEAAPDHIELLLAAAAQAFEYVKNDGTVVLSTASPLDDADIPYQSEEDLALVQAEYAYFVDGHGQGF